VPAELPVQIFDTLGDYMGPFAGCYNMIFVQGKDRWSAGILANLLVYVFIARYAYFGVDNQKKSNL
jgi:hypothetical protein